ncbi:MULTISPECIES: Ig-like domain-containing protein [unclassified Arsukibacterium]|uniref:Ig-like domain-containing protein n=1 Tax=unclassified Arsukibacterium TaxID=2635278 RepID=UPI000C97C0CA|nr:MULTISPECIES: Ig-like domain-containing protein [unclassified Arsukibacterium]MAA93055.1 hypothetical protein [Rheinheimera sp.]HAW93864.1 hypothetical protein [Candidatus Azambacteria bacterium]|tara:strand:+ start:42 stop:530 length:489 start_codon:yes stop_codon:yes gene_type:complete
MNNLALKTALLLVTIAGLAACNSSDKPNEAPQLISTSFVTETDEAISDKLQASDPENDRLRYTLVMAAESGMVNVQSDGQFVYTPGSEFTGNDSFAVAITDGENVVEATVSIDVQVAVVSFLNYSREAFNQDATDTPLSVNGREFTADAMAEADYTDLLQGL